MTVFPSGEHFGIGSDCGKEVLDLRVVPDSKSTHNQAVCTDCKCEFNWNFETNISVVFSARVKHIFWKGGGRENQIDYLGSYPIPSICSDGNLVKISTNPWGRICGEGREVSRRRSSRLIASIKEVEVRVVPQTTRCLRYYVPHFTYRRKIIKVQRKISKNMM